MRLIDRKAMARIMIAPCAVGKSLETMAPTASRPTPGHENMVSVTRPGGCAIVAEGYDPDLERLSMPASRFVGVKSMGIWWSHSIKSMALMMETAGFRDVHVVSRFEAQNRVGQFPKVVLRGYAPAE